MTTYAGTDFMQDIKRGKVGEQIFEEDFLEFLKINYVNVTNKQAFQVIDTDFATKIGKYEVKCNYHDDKRIIIEEYTNFNTELGDISYGWFYKSDADLMVFISKTTKTMVLIPWTDEFKLHYETIKETYNLIQNKMSMNGKNKWQSAFRYIPLSAISGYYSYYKRIT